MLPYRFYELEAEGHQGSRKETKRAKGERRYKNITSLAFITKGRLCRLATRGAGLVPPSAAPGDCLTHSSRGAEARTDIDIGPYSKKLNSLTVTLPKGHRDDEQGCQECLCW
ncbi:hypothetical protein E2C01_044252 [Portunus trituberculatus]|uniref:Uncharacterized protein n=1 Tax=Portunus trituberculatus TaxID=210409 RepID=A0A5B7G1S6_PORTR|nr:hypothetical protein [Portunus trituberculatus]